MSDLPTLAMEALRAVTLDATLARLDVRIPELQHRHVAAEASAGQEVAEAERVSSGPYAWWLGLTGGADVVAKEQAEARDAVAALQTVREELYATVRERDEAREARARLGDVAERFERALAADRPDDAARVSRAHALHARATEALALTDEILAHLRRAADLADGFGRGGSTMGPRDARLVAPAEVDLLNFRFADIRSALDRLQAALAAAGSDLVVRRSTKDLDLSALDGTFVTDAHVVAVLSTVSDALDQQRQAIRAAVPGSRQLRARVADERLAITRAVVDLVVADQL